MTDLEAANNYFKQAQYDDAIKIYTTLLEEDNDNSKILSNRCLSYIKLGNYKLSLSDAISVVRLEPESAKGWGRLGASLYGVNKFEEAITAYSKAYELEPLEIYSQMVKEINTKIDEVKKTVFENSLLNKMKEGSEPVNNLFSSMFGKMLESVQTNTKLMDKLSNRDFQNKVLSMETSPLSALNDSEVTDVLMEMLKSTKFE